MPFAIALFSAYVDVPRLLDGLDLGRASARWPTEEAASLVLAATLNSAPHRRYAVVDVDRPLSDYAIWQDREARRFADATYDPTPWHDEPWYQARHGELFAHMSRKVPGCVSFTENPAKGEADRQAVATRPGRFLAKFFADVLTPTEIEKWSNRAGASVLSASLTITQDADEIEEVYLGGPQSCMSHSLDHYQGYVHPVRVYAGPDLGLAYIGPRAKALARTIVWPERKLFGRVYPDCGAERTSLIEKLTAAGYCHDNFKGARLQRIPYCDGLIMPYLDGGNEVYDDGTVLKINVPAHGTFVDSGSTEGLSYPGDQSCCYNCDSNCRDTYTVDGEDWCECCYENYAFTCEHDGDSYHVDAGFTEVYYGTYGYSRTVLDANLSDHGAVYVENRNEHWHEDDVWVCSLTLNAFVRHHDEPVETPDGPCSHEALVDLYTNQVARGEGYTSHILAYLNRNTPMALAA